MMTVLLVSYSIDVQLVINIFLSFFTSMTSSDLPSHIPSTFTFHLSDLSFELMWHTLLCHSNTKNKSQISFTLYLTVFKKQYIDICDSGHRYAKRKDRIVIVTTSMPLIINLLSKGFPGAKLRQLVDIFLLIDLLDNHSPC